MKLWTIVFILFLLKSSYSQETWGIEDTNFSYLMDFEETLFDNTKKINEVIDDISNKKRTSLFISEGRDIDERKFSILVEGDTLKHFFFKSFLSFGESEVKIIDNKYYVSQNLIIFKDSKKVIAFFDQNKTLFPEKCISIGYDSENLYNLYYSERETVWCKFNKKTEKLEFKYLGKNLNFTNDKRIDVYNNNATIPKVIVSKNFIISSSDKSVDIIDVKTLEKRLAINSTKKIFNMFLTTDEKYLIVGLEKSIDYDYYNGIIEFMAVYSFAENQVVKNISLNSGYSGKMLKIENSNWAIIFSKPHMVTTHFQLETDNYSGIESKIESTLRFKIIDNDHLNTLIKTYIGKTNKVALIIGNEMYKENSLNKAKNDAQDFKLLLEKNQYKILPLCLSCGFNEVNNSLKNFYSLLNYSDFGIIYYSGHGVDFENENHILPVDFKFDKFNNTLQKTIKLNDIIENISKIKNKPTVLIIMDACRNEIAEINQFNFFGINSGAIKDKESKITLIFSTLPGQYSREYPKDRNSLFTKYLLNELAKPNSEALNAVEKSIQKILEVTNFNQQPFYIGNGSRKFLFNLK